TEAQVVVVERGGRATRQPVPPMMGRPEFVEVGRGAILVGAARGLLLLRPGGVVPLLLPAAHPTGAAPDPAGGFRVCAEAGDGPALPLGRVVVQAGRRLVWLDRSTGHALDRSTPPEPPTVGERAATPLDETPPTVAPGGDLVAASRDALVLVGGDGRERYR